MYAARDSNTSTCMLRPILTTASLKGASGPGSQFFRLLVYVFVNRSVLERLRPQFFTDFHQILQAAQECRRIDAYL